jgi:hypothetical protein
MSAAKRTQHRVRGPAVMIDIETPQAARRAGRRNGFLLAAQS